MFMKRLIALSSLFALALAACQPAGSGSQDPIKIGYLGPLTGDAASYGVDTLNGVKMALEEINAAGGIDGRVVQLVAEDGRCTGSDAASAAQKLVHVDKVVAIIGGQCSGETLAAAPITEAAEIILLSPLSSSPDVTAAGDFVFRDYPSDALKTKAMAAYFAEQGYTKIATIGENTDFCTAFRDALKEEVGEDALVFDELVEPNTKDFRTLVTRLKDVEFDVFFPNCQGPPVCAAMMQQLRELGIEAPAIGHDVADAQSVIEVGGEAVEGLRTINVPASGKDSNFEVTYVGTYGEPQSNLAFAAHAYDAANVLFEAIGAVGTEGPAIRDYLYSLEGFDGVVGRFSFDENGDVLGIPYVLKEIQNGKFVKLADISVE